MHGQNYTFDNNGNLLNDGANTYTYDSANRLVSVNGTDSYTYNGLGDRLTQNGTQYTLDLNAGLTQVLADGTNMYVYGNGRIAQVNTTSEYFLGDALGSVRQMTNPASEITFTQSYDPYGVVTSTSGDSHTEYGFTGESYGDSTQLLYLRARYYNPADGRFQSRDTWGGNENRPLSMNRWGYVEGNPVNLMDPSGNAPNGGLPIHCQAMSNKGQYEQCVLRYFDLEPINPSLMGITITGDQGCYVGPKAYRAPGYIEGLSVTGGSGVRGTWGVEVVYDFATMQRQVFEYSGIGFEYEIGIADSQYLGVVKGLRNSFLDPNVDLTDDYSGPTSNTIIGLTVGPGLNINGGANIFSSMEDRLIRGVSVYIGGSLGVGGLPLPTSGLDLGSYVLNYSEASTLYNYTSQTTGLISRHYSK